MADAGADARVDAVTDVDDHQPRPGRGYGALATIGAVGAAFIASLCCVGPLLFVTLGVGAGLASTFEPVRPLFTVLTVALLGFGFYVVYGKRRSAAAACGPDGACAVPSTRRPDVVLLWTATIIAAGLLTFPHWSTLLI